MTLAQFKIRNDIMLRVSALTALLIMLVSGLSLYWLWAREVEFAIAEAQSDSSVYARLLSSNIDSILSTSVQSVEPLVQRLQQLSPEKYDNQAVLHQYLAEVRTKQDVLQLTLIDRSGWTIARREDLNSPKVDLRDWHDVKIFTQQGRTRSFVGPPVTGRFSDVKTIQLIIPVFDSVQGAQGSLKYLIVASIPDSTFTEIFSDPAASQSVTFGVVGFDGRVRWHSGWLDEAGQDRSKREQFRTLKMLGAGPYILEQGHDGRKRAGFVVPSAKWELMFAASIPFDAILSTLTSFKQALIGIWSIIALCSLLSFMLLRMYYVKLQAESQQASARADSEILEGLGTIRNLLVIKDLNEVSIAKLVSNRPDFGNNPVFLESMSRALFQSTKIARDTDMFPVAFADRSANCGEPIEVHWTYIKYKAYDETRIALIGVDRTEYARNELKLYQLSKLATLGEMSTAMAHELTQPYNVISLASANLRRLLLAVPETQREQILPKLTRIDGAVERGRNVIDHMRVFGRTAEQSDQSSSAIDAIEGLETLIGETLRLFDIQLKFAIDVEIPPVAIAQSLLEQVLLNIVGNSVDAIEAKRAQAGPIEDATIVISARVTGDAGMDYVVISVEDCGGGVPPALRERLFQPFFTTKPKGKGTGLGLSINFGIVHEAGGSITYRDGDRGAVFEIRLPVAPERDPSLDAARLPRPPQIALPGVAGQ